MALTDSVPAPASRALACCLLVVPQRRLPAPPSATELVPLPMALTRREVPPPSTTEPVLPPKPPVTLMRRDPTPPSTAELGVVNTGVVGGRPDEPPMFPGSYKSLMQESSDGIGFYFVYGGADAYG
jgi:hypothetical protein